MVRTEEKPRPINLRVVGNENVEIVKTRIKMDAGRMKSEAEGSGSTSTSSSASSKMQLDVWHELPCAYKRKLDQPVNGSLKCSRPELEMRHLARLCARRS